jgi:ribosomal protein L18E
LIPNLRKINVNSFLKDVNRTLEKDYLTLGYLDRESVEVIKKLFDLSKTQLYQGNIKEEGLSFYTGAIVLNTMSMEDAARVFVHEILHSYTTYAYDTDATFRKEINKYHRIALNYNSGFSKDVYEFMAHTLNPFHMASLLEIPSENDSSNLLKDIINSLVRHIIAFFKVYENNKKRTLFHDIIETIYNHKRNNSEFINDVSKVVDENGEPKVVYHFTDNENLNIFSTDFDNYFSQNGGTKKAIFFTEDNTIPGSEDNFLTSRNSKLALFLNIKNL